MKTRHKGLEKNAHWLFVTCALANLYLMRRRLWRLLGASVWPTVRFPESTAVCATGALGIVFLLLSLLHVCSPPSAW
ncbi:MAG: hypothetical protein ACREYF_29540 [Gammaproteobacteria bacterium]